MHPISRAEISAAEWDGLVHGSPDGWVFSLFGWQDLILTVERWSLQEMSFGLRENGRLVAVVPLQFNPNNRRVSSSGWSGSGPVLDGSLSPAARDRILEAAIGHCLDRARQCGADAFDFTLSPVTRSSINAPWGVNPFVFHGLDDVSGLSQVIDLAQPEDRLWADLSTLTHRMIHRARKHGYSVERLDWAESLDHYYGLHCATYRRTGVPPHPRSYFAGIAAVTAASGNSVLWGVRDPSGSIVACHNSAWFGEGAYYHTGCSEDGANQTGASYLLFWGAILGARAAGLRWYDCGAIFPNATDAKQRGLTTFKTKFGGTPHRMFQVQATFPQPEAPPVRRSLPRRAASRLKRILCEGILR
ncbi:lipid II:glycine glycyltransferase FemX [Oleispirillum naphthae]|uniref:lipid II:glycine glycyltransferase FemX n=1 Tax=Oleispirillum naphthae TaxID=2838853 RepID=UPI003082581E